MRAVCLLAALLVGGTVWAAPCERGQPKDDETLLRLEETWAKAPDRHDIETVSCLLADEFQDADVDGGVHDRTDALARIPQRRPSLNHLEDMQVHLYGDTAFLRGVNQVTDASGRVLARVRFTDIFVYRDGRWQAVAGQETLVKPLSSAVRSGTRNTFANFARNATVSP
jgi:ketosteroid isomerase-like protein